MAEEWLATRTKARPQTVATYRRILEQWVYPEFGARRIAAIKPADVGRFINGLKTAETQPPHRPHPLRPATIARIVGPLKAVLEHAVHEDYIRKNPADRVALPSEDDMGVPEFRGRALAWEEVTAIAEKAALREPMFGLVVRLLALTGLRAAELAGLRIDDYSPGWLRVDETRTRDREAPEGGAVQRAQVAHLAPSGASRCEARRRARRTCGVAPAAGRPARRSLPGPLGEPRVGARPRPPGPFQLGQAH